MKCLPGCTCGRHAGKGGPPRPPTTDARSGETQAQYVLRHKRLRRVCGSAARHLCEGGCQGRARDWAQIHGTSGLDFLADYVPLCRSCHIQYDSDARLNMDSRSRWLAGTSAAWTDERRAERGRETARRWTPERRAEHSDRIRELRAARPEWQNRRPLSPEAIREIRALHAAGGLSKAALAARFDIDPSTVSRIVARLLYRDVA